MKFKDFLTFGTESLELGFDLISGFIQHDITQYGTALIGTITRATNAVVGWYNRKEKNDELKNLNIQNQKFFRQESCASSTAATTAAILNSMGEVAGVSYLVINACYGDQETVPQPLSYLRSGGLIASYTLKQSAKFFDRYADRLVESERKEYQGRHQIKNISLTKENEELKKEIEELEELKENEENDWSFSAARTPFPPRRKYGN